MRKVTNEELQNDIEMMKYHIITSKIADRLTQTFHFDNFYEHQIAAWDKLSQKDQKAYLEFIAKPNMTLNEFFDRFAREARTRRYTNNNVEMLNQLLKEEQPDLMIDPCAGWGHRMLMAASRGVEYIGIDIREDITEENANLYEYVKDSFKPSKVTLIAGDGAESVNNLTNIENRNSLLFTCPPYHDAEIYSENGIENALYPEFLEWWQNIAKAAKKQNIETFAYQITRDYGDDMLVMCEKEGYVLDHIIYNTRKEKPGKHVNTKGHLSERKYGVIYVLKLKETN